MIDICGKRNANYLGKEIYSEVTCYQFVNTKNQAVTTENEELQHIMEFQSYKTNA